MLWGRSGNICAYPDCKKVLVADETLTDDPSVVGEEAHIVGRKVDGPRGISDLTEEQRDYYGNLILLCRNHHKKVDDQHNQYSVKLLTEYKRNQEKWVSDNLLLDKQKTKEDELYAGYIQKFIEFTDLHNWQNWTSWILGTSEFFPKERFDALQKLPDYIVSRIWPKRYPTLESSLINFKNILNDIFKVYHIYMDENANGYGIEKFYRNYYPEKYIHNSEKYSREEENRQLEKYQFHVALIEDLILELTRAANYICDKIREFIFEGFRLEEGAILVTRGDFMKANTFRLEYREGQRTDYPYTGLKEFMTIRNERDYQIGEGFEEDYFRKMPWEE